MVTFCSTFDIVQRNNLRKIKYLNNCRTAVHRFVSKNNKMLFKKNINAFVFLAIAALAAMTGLQNTRIRNMPKEPDMTCEDNLAEEKEKCEAEKKGTYCCFER